MVGSTSHSLRAIDASWQLSSPAQAGKGDPLGTEPCRRSLGEHRIQ